MPGSAESLDSTLGLTTEQRVDEALRVQGEITELGARLFTLMAEVSSEDRAEFMRELGRRDTAYDIHDVEKGLIRAVMTASSNVRGGRVRVEGQTRTLWSFFDEGKRQVRLEAADRNR